MKKRNLTSPRGPKSRVGLFRKIVLGTAGAATILIGGHEIPQPKPIVPMYGDAVAGTKSKPRVRMPRAKQSIATARDEARIQPRESLHETRILRRNVLYSEFSPYTVDVHVMSAEQPKQLGYFIEEANRKYGRQNVLLAFTGGFFERTTGKSIGKIVENGKVIENGIFSGEQTFMVFSPEAGVPLSIANSWNRENTALGGLVELVRDSRVCVSGDRQRHWLPRPMTAIAIMPNGNARVVLATTTEKHFAKMLRTMGAVSAARLEGGKERALYRRGEILRREKNVPIKSVVIVTRKQADS